MLRRRPERPLALTKQDNDAATTRGSSAKEAAADVVLALLCDRTTLAKSPIRGSHCASGAPAKMVWSFRSRRGSWIWGVTATAAR
jgi:hypothetical protein